MVSVMESPMKLNPPAGASGLPQRYSQAMRYSIDFSEEALPYIELSNAVRSNLRKLNLVVDNASICFEEEKQMSLHLKQRVRTDGLID